MKPDQPDKKIRINLISFPSISVTLQLGNFVTRERAHPSHASLNFIITCFLIHGSSRPGLMYVWPDVLMINTIGQSCLRKDQSRLQMCSIPETLTPDATLSPKVLSSDDGTSLILPGTFSSMFSRGLTWGTGLLVRPGFATLSVRSLHDWASESLCFLVL